MDVSIIICCYNSENRIVPTLEHLSKQILGNLQCEIILIDNNCSDKTIQIANQTWNYLRNPFQLHILKEIQPGLSFARKCGVNAAKGEIIVFCDDDNWLGKEYIKTAFDLMQNDLSIGVLAGQSRAVSEIEIPTWFYTFYGYYACGVLGIHSGDVSKRLWVWGAGMVVRKSQMALLYSKYTHITKDRTKESMESGGDMEICFWHLLEHKKLWYDNRLMLNHFMPAERLNIENALRQFQAQDESSKKLKILTDLVSRFLEYHNGSLCIRSIFRDFIKLRMRSGLMSFKFYLKFKFCNS